MRPLSFFAWKRKKELEGWKLLHVDLTASAVDTLKVLMTQLLQKHLGVTKKDTMKTRWHGSERRPTMYSVSMDTKTACDVARPKPVEKNG